MPRRAWMIIAALGSGVVLASCTITGSSGKSPKQIMTAADFLDEQVVRTAPPPQAIPAASGDASAPRMGVEAIVGSDPSPVPIAGGQGGPAVGDLLVIDEMVGQVNGKPIYAEEFFRDMDARLREQSLRTPLRQWVKDVRKDVEGKLWDLTRDELLLAEFRSTLTPEMRVGMLAFVEDVRSNLEALAGGSEEQANERSLEEEGLSLREKVKDVSERQFVLTQLKKAIANRVYVSSRDVEQYYAQNYDKFNPPPFVVMVVIKVQTVDAARVESRLASGEDFRAIAVDVSEWAKDKNNEHRVLLEEESVSEQTIWGVPQLNEPCRKLAVGEVTPRIDLGSSTWWCKLEAIEQQPHLTLYEAQLGIERTLKDQRLREEEQRYFEKLLAKSNVSDLDSMTGLLVQYAAVRYYVHPETETGG